MCNVIVITIFVLIVFFSFSVFNLNAEATSNRETPAQQLVTTASSYRQYNFPSSHIPPNNNDLPVGGTPIGNLQQTRLPPTLPPPSLSPPLPPAPSPPAPLPPAPSPSPATATVQVIQQQSLPPLVDPDYVTISIPHKNSENTCPPLKNNMDNLTQDQFSSILTHECRYDKLIKPDKPEPFNITVQIDIKHIEAIEQLQFKMHMLLQYRYTDYRLRYDKISPTRGIMLGEELLRNRIWVPHIVLANERESAIMGLGGNDLFVSISPEGEVIFSYRMTATIYCWMNLKKFPFDSQSCDLSFRSWTYNASKLVLQWDEEEPVKVANQLHLTEFTLADYHTFSRLDAPSLSHGAFVGNYSILVFKFILSREVGYYIMDYFIPSMLLVVTSWVTFWLQADNAAPRITLGTSTMLAFITLAQGQSKNLPKVSYIKASEIWFLACTVFIFASMVEFAFVNIIWRRKKKVELKKVNSKYILKSTLTPKLARKELQRSNSTNNLHKSHSCSSLATCNNSNNKGNVTPYNNYLTVHSFPSTLNLPTITTQSDDDLINTDSQVTISVPNKTLESEQQQDKLQKWTSMTPQEVAIWIDKRSRVVFPCAFLVFNIFYWSFVYGL